MREVEVEVKVEVEVEDAAECGACSQWAYLIPHNDPSVDDKLRNLIRRSRGLFAA